MAFVIYILAFTWSCYFQSRSCNYVLLEYSRASALLYPWSYTYKFLSSNFPLQSWLYRHPVTFISHPLFPMRPFQNRRLLGCSMHDQTSLHPSNLAFYISSLAFIRSSYSYSWYCNFTSDYFRSSIQIPWIGAIPNLSWANNHMHKWHLCFPVLHSLDPVTLRLFFCVSTCCVRQLVQVERFSLVWLCEAGSVNARKGTESTLNSNDFTVSLDRSGELRKRRAPHRTSEAGKFETAKLIGVLELECTWLAASTQLNKTKAADVNPMCKIHRRQRCIKRLIKPASVMWTTAWCLVHDLFKLGLTPREVHSIRRNVLNGVVHIPCSECVTQPRIFFFFLICINVSENSFSRVTVKQWWWCPGRTWLNIQ